MLILQPPPNAVDTAVIPAWITVSKIQGGESSLPSMANGFRQSLPERRKKTVSTAFVPHPSKKTHSSSKNQIFADMKTLGKRGIYFCGFRQGGRKSYHATQAASYVQTICLNIKYFLAKPTNHSLDFYHDYPKLPPPPPSSLASALASTPSPVCKCQARCQPLQPRLARACPASFSLKSVRRSIVSTRPPATPLG